MQKLLEMLKRLKSLDVGTLTKVWSEIEEFLAARTAEEKAEHVTHIVDILGDLTETPWDDDVAQFAGRLLDDPFVEKILRQWDRDLNGERVMPEAEEDPQPEVAEESGEGDSGLL